MTRLTMSQDRAHGEPRSLRSKEGEGEARGIEDHLPPPTFIFDLVRKDQEAHAEVLGIRCPSKVPTGDDLELCAQALVQFNGEERHWIHLGHRAQIKDKRRFQSYPNTYPRRRGVEGVELDTAWCMDRMELGRKIAEASAAEKKARDAELTKRAERDDITEEGRRARKARVREARELLGRGLTPTGAGKGGGHAGGP